MKATDLLERQHREVKALFSRLESTDAARERSRLLDEIAKNLCAHMVIEQEIFYPACASVLDDKSIVAESFEEHGIASLQLRRLLESRGRDTTFEAKAKVLKELVEHHIKEEEDELFKKARRKIDAVTLESLGARMHARFEKQFAQDYRKVLAQTPPDARDALIAKSAVVSKISSGVRRAQTTAGTTRRKAARGGTKKASQRSRSRT